jgi:hypothetical protein
VSRQRLSRIAILGCVAALAVAAAPARADEVRFDPTGAEQTFTVPTGVTTIRVVAVGAKGGTGDGFIDQNPGLGAVASGDLSVTPGQVFYIEVGGNGSTGSGAQGGFNGGGNVAATSPGGSGGGASDVRLAPRAAAGSLDTRLVVAGGGGGSGGGDIGDSISGGGGGAAGATGAGCTTEDGTAGGGQPGTLATGGAGGTHSHPPFGGPGGAGGLGQGGGGGAGGGGGLYGGGGGAYMSGGGLVGENCGAGGGGGSSGFAPSVTNVSIVADTTGQPSITVTYTPPAGPTPAAPGKASFAGSKSSIRVKRNRVFSFAFGAGANLTGTAVFRSAGRVRVSAKRRVTLVQKPFTSAAGGRVRLRVKLSKKNFRILKRNRKIRTRVTVTLTNSSGLSSTASKVIVLKAPRPR